MIGRLERNRSIFFAAFDSEASMFSDPLLSELDELLDDPQLLELVADALGSRHPRSRQTGREGIAPDRALRACVLKHLRGWSFRDLEWELRNGITYRQFTRFDNDKIPKYSAFSRVFALFGDEITRRIHGQVVVRAQAEGIAPGRKLRTDTTVVESNIHYPTDSTLLADGIRVLTRALKGIEKLCPPGVLKVVNRARSTQRRVIEIHRAAKTYSEAGRAKLKTGYEKLLRITTAVVNQGRKVLQQLDMGLLPVTGGVVEVAVQEAKLRHFLPLTQTVIAQTKARISEGNTHFPGKLVSIFEHHSQVIRKGKVHKPTEFGRLVRIDEVENYIVSDYEVADGNPPDETQWVPALLQHKKRFGHAPALAAGDRGFYSKRNEQQAHQLGVRKVALPAKGRLSEIQANKQKQPWFKWACRWRGLGEGRIGTLKHQLHMLRAVYKGDIGFKRHVGWSIIVNNLVSITRARKRKIIQDAPQKLAA